MTKQQEALIDLDTDPVIIDRDTNIVTIDRDTNLMLSKI